MAHGAAHTSECKEHKNEHDRLKKQQRSAADNALSPHNGRNRFSLVKLGRNTKERLVTEIIRSVVDLISTRKNGLLLSIWFRGCGTKSTIHSLAAGPKSVCRVRDESEQPVKKTAVENVRAAE